MNNKDINILNTAINYYNNYKFTKSSKEFNKIIDKYKNYEITDINLFQLFVNYDTICNTLNKENKYFVKLTNCNHIVKNFDEKNKLQFYQLFTNSCLSKGEFDLVYQDKYLNYINYVIGPGVEPKDADFVKESDKDKTTLLYIGGGLGDKIMFFRFLPMLCQKFDKNNFIFLLEDRLIWLFENSFGHIPNLKILKFSQKASVVNLKYDYQHNLCYSMKILNLNSREKIPFVPFLKNFDDEIKIQTIREEISSMGKKYVINWHGAYQNKHEKKNRGMGLENLVPLFEMEDVTWIILTLEISESEKNILDKYDNVKNYSKLIDKENSFQDTISIMKNVDGVITTDTSLAHLAGSMDINLYVLLTKYPEWRWGNEKSTYWYPNAKLLRQEEFGNWQSVIKELKINIQESKNK